jgi:hypothetical protein
MEEKTSATKPESSSGSAPCTAEAETSSTGVPHFVLPKKIPDGLVSKVFVTWKAGGIPLTKLFPLRKDYLRIRLAMMDLGLVGNQLRAERLAKQRERERARHSRKISERDAQRAQSLNDALTTFIGQTIPSPTLTLPLASTRESSSASSWTAEERSSTSDGCRATSLPPAPTTQSS